MKYSKHRCSSCLKQPVVEDAGNDGWWLMGKQYCKPCFDFFKNRDYGDKDIMQLKSRERIMEEREEQFNRERLEPLGDD